MAARKPKLEYSIICDDIRQEVGNKLSFMGIYGSDINIPMVPFTFPQLCAAISYKDVKKGDSFEIKLKDPTGKLVGQPIKGSIPPEAKGNIKFMIFAKFAPLKVEKEGSLKIIIIFNKEESTKKEISIPIKKRE
jgi:hypothetical protein